MLGPVWGGSVPYALRTVNLCRRQPPQDNALGLTRGGRSPSFQISPRSPHAAGCSR